MNDKLILTGVSGPKSGFSLIEYIAGNIDVIKSQFHGGITVVCRETSNVEKISNLIPDIELYRGDFDNSVFLREALAGCDTLLHVAGIHYSMSIVDAAISNHVRRIILVHTTGIYSKYKAAGEEYRRIDEYVEKQCKLNNVLLTILRPTMIYGNVYDENVISFISMVDKFPIMPVVKGARFNLQPVHFQDLGKAYFDVLINEKTCNHNYILSGGEVIQLRDMLSVIGENLGKRVVFCSCPYWIAYSGAWFIYVLSFSKLDYRERVQRLCEHRSYDHTDATRDFGYNPRTFRVGIVNEVKEYIEKKKSHITK